MAASEAIRALCAAWERGDPDALAGLFSEDGVYEDPLMEGPCPSPAQARPIMSRLPQWSEERLQVRGQLGWGFHRGEMLPALELGPDRLVGGLRPFLRR